MNPSTPFLLPRAHLERLRVSATFRATIRNPQAFTGKAQLIAKYILDSFPRVLLAHIILVSFPSRGDLLQAIRMHFDDFLPISRSNRAGRSHARHITLHIPILGSKSPGARAGITTGELTSRRGPAVTDLHVAGSALDRAETNGATPRACLISQLVVRHCCGGTVLVLIAEVLFEPKALGVMEATFGVRDISGDVATAMNGAHTREIDLSDPLPWFSSDWRRGFGSDCEGRLLGRLKGACHGKACSASNDE
jgi:hypothetical protein